VIARLLILAALVALVAVLVEWRVLDRGPEQPTGEVQRPGYYLTGVDLQEFGADGQLRIGLESVSAVEDPATGIVRLAEVAVDYHAPKGRRWQLTAEQARVPPGGRVVEFEGDVRLSGAPQAGQAAAQLRTARLALDTATEIAETRSPVELAFGAHRMRALGMRADLEAGRVRLNADVNGRFTP
jgi:lipopolysaccharide export system protein LptC